ncbi:hypothetical protein [Rhizobium mesoamericanum]|uniref:hypothetical protein n=1 Tax=Rhizobium mesoamericanum TaxID=1079800 RepID=UPI000408F58D|nr:hypothetical protein [Rhizobium mesoamericanum]
MATEGDAETRYYSLLMSATKTLHEKERELSRIVTGVVIFAAILFVAWLYHEDAWQAKLVPVHKR